jgi:O-acetyl-ADP-ribose deacetylase (regulator of RNase III)
MIKVADGNLLTADAEALVNTVNTVGVMGKGIALQFKRAFPGNYKAYKRACDRGEVKLGRMFVWDTGGLTAGHPRYIINFPTKGHWRARSKLSDIEAGLVDLVRVIREHDIRSVAVPPLGCGHGGLQWRDVEPLILAAFEALPDVDARLFRPEGAPEASDQPVRTPRPRMTQAKAALVAMMHQYLPFTVDVTTVDIQKLMYFMQEAGEPLSLGYVKGHYGPYADNLRHLLASMEGHYIRGMGDQSARALDVVPFEIMPGAVDEADRELDQHAITRERVERVLRLVEGFESTYGLELLATVHWAATRRKDGKHVAKRRKAAAIESTVRSWNTRKGMIFTPRHIAIALDRLERDGWLERPNPSGQLALLD